MKELDRKTQLIILLVGVGLAIAGPLFGLILERRTLVNKDEIIIDQDSQVSFEDVYSLPFTLKKNGKAIIEFSVYYENVTANLKIFGQGKFDGEVSQNGTNDPQTENGQYFMVTTRDWTWGPFGTTMRLATCALDDYYYIEFMGDGDNTNRIWSEPGDYVVVVYGANSFVNSTTVKFNLKVTIDGVGPILNTIFSIVGWGMMVAIGIIYVVNNYPQKGEEE
ncbi:MAG: hypothetical protein GF364_18800 [Candidatus Lokiarchaeota archaeon]|nr:hypothetical protein [Candidatus Lokiarchaeota archaeon]